MSTPNISPINTTHFVRKSTNNLKSEIGFEKKLASPSIMLNNIKLSNSVLNQNLSVKSILNDLKMSKYIDIFTKEEVRFLIFLKIILKN